MPEGTGMDTKLTLEEREALAMYRKLRETFTREELAEMLSERVRTKGRETGKEPDVIEEAAAVVETVALGAAALTLGLF